MRSAAATALEAHQLQRLIMAGDPTAADAAPMWRRVASHLLSRMATILPRDWERLYGHLT